jgi:hypothetical protein
MARRAIGSLKPQKGPGSAPTVGTEKSPVRKALVVGIDHYTHLGRLWGCVNDANAVKRVLETHGNREKNFDVRLMTAAESTEVIDRGDLKDNIDWLFSGESEIALLYFAGHGDVGKTGGYICGTECRRGYDGMPLADVLTLANHSDCRAMHRVIVLDSCYSGVAGSRAGQQNTELSEGTAILTSSTGQQYATEQNGGGVFTTLFVDALEGAASNLVGGITLGAVYSHIDQALSVPGQRPMFKSNVKEFVTLRTVPPPITLAELRRITEFFPTRGCEYPVDPTYEDDLKGRPLNAPPPSPENTEKFAILRLYRSLNLLVPVDAPYMWNAAMESKSCKLTVLGEHYRSLVERDLI